MRPFQLLVILLTTTPLNAQQWNWAVSAGGTSNNDHFLGIANDSEGNLYGVGTVRATADFGCGILAPGNSNGGFIAKYSESGECIWVQGIITNGIGAWVYDIAIDHEDRIYIAGNFRGNTSFGSGISMSASGRTWFVARYDTEGNCEWVKRGGSTSTGDLSEARGIAVDEDGTIYVTGTAAGNTFTFAPVSVANPNTSSTQLVVMAYNSNGDGLWARSSAGAGYDNKTPNAIAVENGRLFITGQIDNTVSTYDGLDLSAGSSWRYLYVLATDLQGNGLWAHNYGPGLHEGKGIAADTLGNLFVGGLMRGTIELPDGTLTTIPTNDEDIVLFGFGQDGTYRWGKTTGTEGRDLFSDVITDNMGNAYFAGQFENTIDFFGIPLTSAGSSDVLIAKIEADGDVVWAQRAGGTGGGVDAALTIHRRPTAPHTLAFGGYYSLTATYGNTTITEMGNHDGMLVSGIDTTFHVSTHAMATCGGDCSGQAYAFVNGTSPFTFTWADGSTTPSIVGLCADAYAVTVSDAAGYVSTVSVNVQEAQDPEYSVQVDGDSLWLTGGSAWQWYFNGSELAGADSTTLIAQETGNYHAVINDDMSGCTWSTDTVLVVLNVGIAGVKEQGSLLWPNPAADLVYLQNPGAEVLHGRLLNATGQLMLEVTLVPGRNTIGITDLPQGLYLLEVLQGGVFRLVKQ